MTVSEQGARTYQVRTFGCQMNVHDSERLAGLLEEAGYVPAREGETPDVVVFNTCAVRENADNRLYGNLGHLRPIKAKHPGMQIAVGGCLAQKDQGEIVRRAPWVDVVFGTHNLGSLPVLLERARVQREAQVEIKEALEVFPSTLPTRRESVYAAWVAISVGCNNTCTFCIVPSLRGKERDRRPGDVLAEIRALVEQGVLEVTLLGQNVNTYGVEFGDRQAFSKLLRACGEIEGLERVRFTSPHPAAFTDDVIEAMAETPNVMPSLHMPLQSGSDRDPARDAPLLPRRSASSASSSGCARRSRTPRSPPTSSSASRARPRRTSRPPSTWYGRPGSPAPSPSSTRSGPARPRRPWRTRCRSEVVQERYERLVALQNDISWEENKAQVGRVLEVLVAEGEGRKDDATHRMTGRAPDNRLVHFTPVGEHGVPRPGDMVTVEVTQAAPHHLIADGPILALRRTRAGDAWEARQSAACGAGAGGSGGRSPVLLGMPAIRRG